MKLDWRKTFLIGFGFLGISVINQIYNQFMPLFLQAGNPTFDARSEASILGFGLSASLTGFIMTLDNIAALFILPVIGVWSDRTRTRIGRRYPYILIGAPIAAIAFILIPIAARLINPAANGSVQANAGSFSFFMIAAGLMLLAMALFRTPVIALMPDLTPSPLRSKANGIINFMGGVGGVIAALGIGSLFDLNPLYPFLTGSVLLLVAVGVLFFTVKEPDPETLKGDQEEEKGEARILGANLLLLVIAVIALTGFVAVTTIETLDPALRQSGTIVTLAAFVLSFGWFMLNATRTAPPAYRRSLLLLMVAIFGWFVGYNAIETFFSSYAVTTLGMKPGEAGRLFSIALITFIVSAIPAGYIGSRLGRKRTILLGLAIFAALLGVGYFVPNTIVVAVILGLGGMAWALVNINSLPMVVDITESERLLGTYTGLYYLASQSAAIFGPILNGSIIDAAGQNYNVIFLVTPAFFILAILAMLFVTRGEARQAAVPVSQH